LIRTSTRVSFSKNALAALVTAVRSSSCSWRKAKYPLDVRAILYFINGVFGPRLVAVGYINHRVRGIKQAGHFPADP
jgi:hypothetical protein